MGASRKGGIVGKQAGAFPRRKVVVPAGGFDGDKRERRTADTLAFAEDVEAIPVINMQVNDVIEAVAVVADTVGVVDTVVAAAVADVVVSRVTAGVVAVAVVLFAAFANAIARVARRLRRPNGDARSLNIKREEGCRGIFGTGRSRIRGRRLAIIHGNHFGRGGVGDKRNRAPVRKFPCARRMICGRKGVVSARPIAALLDGEVADL